MESNVENRIGATCKMIEHGHSRGRGVGEGCLDPFSKRSNTGLDDIALGSRFHFQPNRDVVIKSESVLFFEFVLDLIC